MVDAERDRVPVLTAVGDALERLVFTTLYRRFVQALVVVVALLLVVHGIRFATTGVFDLTAESVGVLDLVTSAAVTLFVIAGVIQVLLFSRGVARRRAVIEESAEEVETSAEEIAEAASELEATIDEVPAEKTSGVKETVETAAEKAEDAKEAAEDVKSELQAPNDRETDGADDGES